MNLKSKIILLAVVPLIVATTIITYLSLQSAKELAAEELAIYEFNLINVKKQALKSHVGIAMSAIRPILNDYSIEDEAAKKQVKQILKRLTYDDDGYFFVYTMEGVNLVHPTQPIFVGQDLWNFQDKSGNHLIQHLIAAARAGGGFHRYIWEKPPYMIQEDKIGYTIMIERWDWMVGTGLYLDDIYDELAKTQAIMHSNIQKSFLSVITIVIVTVILVILLGLAINLHEHRLADSRLKELVQRFMRIQVNERRRFSRELHDGINQMLVSCKFRVELATNKLKRNHTTDVIEAELDKAEALINQTINEVRQISHNLRPTLLDDLGLDAAIKSLTSQFSERTGVDIIYTGKLINDLPDEIEITIYRLIQEALSNIEKHAQANKVTLTIWQDKAHIKLECLDNGKGFSQTAELLPGIGLINMRERLELIGGDFTLESRKGAGTKILAKLPLEQTL
ncbi:cache domain-containing protein [Marinomonas algicola]|uniref:cache domain-containing protein n=1 Tax=Marinomonas algicola TaxID=2773454 RepID=UPI00174E967D|nr:cache domain-containing protein [Marinomonas algicola]